LCVSKWLWENKIEMIRVFFFVLTFWFYRKKYMWESGNKKALKALSRERGKHTERENAKERKLSRFIPTTELSTSCLSHLTLNSENSTKFLSLSLSLDFFLWNEIRHSLISRSMLSEKKNVKKKMNLQNLCRKSFPHLHLIAHACEKNAHSLYLKQKIKLLFIHTKKRKKEVGLKWKIDERCIKLSETLQIVLTSQVCLFAFFPQFILFFKEL
jgi:hypothetical protein